MRIFFSVGEPSGDLHGANLIRTIRERCPDVQTVGFGGPRMKAAGMHVLADLTELAVMLFARALANIHRYYRHYRNAGRYFDEHAVDAVVLIDYPGFNWWIARQAKRHGIPVFYYGVPQLWAWAPWRIRKMRRLVDHVLCKLPFEAEWYQQQGCRASFVGHPYFDQLDRHILDQSFLDEQAIRDEPLVAILPGSRTQEIRYNLPSFIRAAELISDRVPHARFAVASYNESQAHMARDLIAESRIQAEVHTGRTAELVKVARATLACSGSVSLELLYYTAPSTVLYRINPITWFIVRHFLVTVRYISLVNLLACDDRYQVSKGPYDRTEPHADRIPFPEYPTYRDRSADMADDICRWLTNDGLRRERVEQLQRLKAELCSSGASSVAADYLVAHIDPAGTPTMESRTQEAA